MPKVQHNLTGQTFYLGIDPGEKGGMALLDSAGKPATDSNCPMRAISFKDRTEHDIFDWLDMVRVMYGSDIKAALELVRAMPGQGSVSMFTFGWNYGFIRGVLVALRIPFLEPTPVVWMRRLAIPPRKKSGNKNKDRKEHKQLLRSRAQERWPKFSSQISATVADALLIAEWRRLEDQNGHT